MELLKLSKINVETDQAKTFYFDISQDVEKWKYKAGQYITIELEINGEKIRRAYSMSTPPSSGELGITIKKVEDGKVSGYMHDKATEGQEFGVLKPQGKFVILPDPEARKDYYFIAAGSGITPIISMIKTILEHEPMSCCHLLYGSRSEDQIIFHKELESLQEDHRDQLHVEHTLSQPATKSKGGITGLFGAKVIQWKGKRGRIDASHCDDFLRDYPSRSKTQQYFVCGPGNLIECVNDCLMLKGVAKDQIFREYFSNPDQDKTSSNGAAAGTSSGIAKLTVHLEGETIEIEHSNDKTILETLMDDGKNPPYSCTAGACSTCVAKVLSGKVTMDECFALDDQEIADGFVLTCQARTASDSVELKYEG